METQNTTSTDVQQSQNEIHSIECNSEQVIVNSVDMAIIRVDEIHHAVRQGDVWKLTIGNYQIGEDMKSLEECEEEAAKITWAKIANLIEITMNIIKTEENE